MAYVFQVVFDCAEPHRLAAWWAEALGWTVEPTDEAFIRRMIAEGHATDADTTTWAGQLVWREGAAIRHPDDPEQGTRRRILSVQTPSRPRPPAWWRPAPRSRTAASRAPTTGSPSSTRRATSSA